MELFKSFGISAIMIGSSTLRSKFKLQTSGWKTTVSLTTVSPGNQQLCAHVNTRTERKCRCVRAALLGNRRRASARAGRSCSSQMARWPQRAQTVSETSGVEGGSGAPRSGGSSREYLWGNK